MTAPAGPCEWCGGPQQWTVALGKMFVRCEFGCLGIFEERVTITSEQRGVDRAHELALQGIGTPGKDGGVPCEGDAAKMSDSELDELPF